MKRTMSLVTVLTTVAAFYCHPNPFLGKWRLDLAGAEDAMVVEFFDDTFSVTPLNSGDTYHYGYELDLPASTLDLRELPPNDLNVPLLVRFDFPNPDIFRLFLTEEAVASSIMGFNEEEFFTESDTEYTKQFYRSLVQAVVEAMTATPVGEGTRLPAASPPAPRSWPSHGFFSP